MVTFRMRIQHFAAICVAFVGCSTAVRQQAETDSLQSPNSGDSVDSQLERNCPTGLVIALNSSDVCCSPDFPWFHEQSGYCLDVNPLVCPFQLDGYCDDGRSGSDSSFCPLGTDPDDCFEVLDQPEPIPQPQPQPQPQPEPEPAPIPDPLPPSPADEIILVANDGEFLGLVSDNKFNIDSLANEFGTYGSRFNALSIWNEFGTYGSKFSDQSPWSEFTQTPPRIFIGDEFFACLTVNDFACGGETYHPVELAIDIGRVDAIRD